MAFLKAMIYLSLFTLGVMSGQVFGGTDPVEANEKVFAGCFTADSKPIDYHIVNNALVPVVCIWGSVEEVLITLTSTFREGDPREHGTGNALDFHRDYSDVEGGLCGVLEAYRASVESFSIFLALAGLAEKVGFGNYPFKLVMHIDLRGHKARWAFDEDENLISFEAGMDLLDERIDGACDDRLEY